MRDGQESTIHIGPLGHHDGRHLEPMPAAINSRCAILPLLEAAALEQQHFSPPGWICDEVPWFIDASESPHFLTSRGMTICDSKFQLQTFREASPIRDGDGGKGNGKECIESTLPRRENGSLATAQQVS